MKVKPENTSSKLLSLKHRLKRNEERRIQISLSPTTDHVNMLCRVKWNIT